MPSIYAIAEATRKWADEPWRSGVLRVPSRPVIVIGQGRVGAALAALDPTATAVDRSEGWEALNRAAGEPVLVCTRNDDLPGVVARVPPHRHEDLVFVQNGMLRGWLEEARLSSVTRGLLFFAVPSRGAPIDVGGESPFCGPHAARVVAWLRAQGVAAVELDATAFAKLELEKLLWNCVFGLLCEVEAASVGAVLDRARNEFEALSAELLEVGRRGMSLDFTDAERTDLIDRLAAYSRSIAEYRGAVKEWNWRNGWFVATAAALDIPCPRHDALLQRIGRGPEPRPTSEDMLAGAGGEA